MTAAFLDPHEPEEETFDKHTINSYPRKELKQITFDLWRIPMGSDNDKKREKVVKKAARRKATATKGASQRVAERKAANHGITRRKVSKKRQPEGD